MPTSGDAKRGWSKGGSNWLILFKRLAIYHRDGFDCVWCRSIFPPMEPYGYGLCIDHVEPGKGNAESNLVTSCADCNIAKHDRDLSEWLPYLSNKTGEAVEAILARVQLQTSLQLDLNEGKRLAYLRSPNRKAHQRFKHLVESTTHENRTSDLAT